MNQQEQINDLNSSTKVKIGVSKIEGVGVIAVRDIAKGERAFLIPPQMLHPNHDLTWFTIPYGSLNKLFPEVKKLILERWPSILNGSHFIHPNDMAWLITFINHSDDFNYDTEKDIALRDIKAGEELTKNYRLMKNYALIYPWLEKMSDNVTTAKNTSMLARVRTILAMLKNWANKR